MPIKKNLTHLKNHVKNHDDRCSCIQNNNFMHTFSWPYRETFTHMIYVFKYNNTVRQNKVVKKCAQASIQNLSQTFQCAISKHNPVMEKVENVH